jgi:co-chaperonin GroES (HSP10)
MRRVDVEKKIIEKMRPVRSDYVFLIYDEIKSSKTATGILVPPSVSHDNDNLRLATVVAVGTKIRTLKVGDRVILHKAYGNTLPHEDDHACRLAYVSEDQVEAIVTGDVEREDFNLAIHSLSLD